MDEGTDAREILENRLLPLRRGVLLFVCMCVCVCTHCVEPSSLSLTTQEALWLRLYWLCVIYACTVCHALSVQTNWNKNHTFLQSDFTIWIFFS